MSCVLKGKHGGKITRGRDKASLSKISFQLNLGKKILVKKHHVWILIVFYIEF